MKSLYTLLFVSLSLLCLQNCAEPIGSGDLAQPTSPIATRSSCTTITSAYINELKNLAGVQLSTSPGSVKIGCAVRADQNNPIWLTPGQVVGYNVTNPSEAVFIGYINSPTDGNVMGYYFDTDFCEVPCLSKSSTGSFNSIVSPKLDVIAEDFTGL